METVKMITVSKCLYKLEDCIIGSMCPNHIADELLGIGVVIEPVPTAQSGNSPRSKNAYPQVLMATVSARMAKMFITIPAFT